MTAALSGSRGSGTVGAVVVLALILLFAGAIGIFDYIGIHGVMKEGVARAFPTVPGRVIESRVRIFQGGGKNRSTGYMPFIRYTYRVNGQAYESNVVRAGFESSMSRPAAERAAAAHPVGSPVTVHYNPKNFSDALLEAGVNGSDLLKALLLYPFNLLLLGIVLSMVRFGGRQPAQVGGAPIIYRGLSEGVRLPQRSPIATAMRVGIITYVLELAVIFLGRYNPSIQGMIWAGILVIAAPILAYLFARLRAIGGRYDLTIDPVRRTVTLPMMFGRTQPIELPLASVHDVQMEEKISNGRNGSTQRKYELSLAYRGLHGNEEQAMLVSWGTKINAEALAAWIRQKVGLMAKAAGNPQGP